MSNFFKIRKLKKIMFNEFVFKKSRSVIKLLKVNAFNFKKIIKVFKLIKKLN